jgi:hypothetical protein
VHIDGFILIIFMLQQSRNQENVHVGIKNEVLGA